MSTVKTIRLPTRSAVSLVFERPTHKTNNMLTSCDAFFTEDELDKVGGTYEYNYSKPFPIYKGLTVTSIVFFKKDCEVL